MGAAELFVLVVSKDTIARGSQAPYSWSHRCSIADRRRSLAWWCRKGRREVKQLPLHPDCAEAMEKKWEKWDRLEAEAEARAPSCE